MSSLVSVPWWYRASAKKALESWIRPLIAPRPYTVRFEVGGGSYMNFTTREIVIDPKAWDFLSLSKHLPITWHGNLIDSETRLQWRLARMAARHEAMHVLFSVPPDCDGTFHFLVNALEDEWMEELARFYYPTAWGDFVACARLLTQYYPLPQPEETTREGMLLFMCLYHRWDWKRSKGTPSRVRFRTPDDEQFWQDTIRPLVEQAWQTHEDAERKKIARQILRLIGLPESAPLSAHDLYLPAPILDIGGERNADDAPVAGTVIDSEAARESGGGKESGDGLSGSDSGGRKGGELPHAALVSLASDEDEAPLPLTAAEELYLLPPQSLENQVRGEKNRLLRALLAKTPEAGEEASPVGSEFDAEAYLRSNGERPFHFFNDDAPDHGGLAVALLIDMTSSMGYWSGEGIDEHGVFRPDFYDPYERMTYARQVAMLFELVCPPAGISLLIGAAGDNGTLCHLPGYRTRYKPDQPVTWLRTRNTPRDSEVTRAAIAGLYGRYGCERISPSLLEAHRELTLCQATTRLIIYIHDGMPTDELPAAIVTVLKTIRSKGTLVVAPYVGEQSEIAKLQAIFGPQWTIPVERLSDLSKRLARVLLKYAHR